MNGFPTLVGGFKILSTKMTIAAVALRIFLNGLSSHDDDGGLDTAVLKYSNQDITGGGKTFLLPRGEE